MHEGLGICLLAVILLLVREPHEYILFKCLKQVSMLLHAVSQRNLPRNSLCPPFTLHFEKQNCTTIELILVIYINISSSLTVLSAIISLPALLLISTRCRHCNINLIGVVHAILCCVFNIVLAIVHSYCFGNSDSRQPAHCHLSPFHV